jgi:hypothetical protein
LYTTLQLTQKLSKIHAKIWQGAVKQNLCMLTARENFNDVSVFQVFDMLCIVDHPKWRTDLRMKKIVNKKLDGRWILQ